MIDQLTRKPIKIIPEEKGGPSLLVVLDQLPQVQTLLDKHGVDYWVPEYASSVNDGPMTIFVYISRRADLKKVQQVLDAA